MPRDKLVLRLLSHVSGVSFFNLQRRRLSSFERDKVNVARPHIDKAAPFLTVIDGLRTIGEATSAVARTHRKVGGLALVCFDYVQLVRPGRDCSTRNEEVAYISGEIASWRNLDCAVLAASQLNRNPTRSEHGPCLADLRDSGAIEQDADAVWLLHDDERKRGPGVRDVTLIIAKNRNGPCGRIELKFDPIRYLFT
jgi:replicative DNA helicase